MTWSSGDCAAAGVKPKSPITPAHESDATNTAVVESEFLTDCIRILRDVSGGRQIRDEAQRNSFNAPSAELEDQSDLSPQLPGRAEFGPKRIVVGAEQKID